MLAILEWTVVEVLISVQRVQCAALASACAKKRCSGGASATLGIQGSQGRGPGRGHPANHPPTATIEISTWSAWKGVMVASAGLSDTWCMVSLNP